MFFDLSLLVFSSEFFIVGMSPIYAAGLLVRWPSRSLLVSHRAKLSSFTRSTVLRLPDRSFIVGICCSCIIRSAVDRETPRICDTSSGLSSFIRRPPSGVHLPTRTGFSSHQSANETVCSLKRSFNMPVTPSLFFATLSSAMSRNLVSRL